jgi:hypothetical protein
MDVLNGNRPEGDKFMQIYQDTETSLVESLAAFTGSNIFEKFATILKNHFSKEWNERDETEKMTVDRIIILLRYIFSIGMECQFTSEVRGFYRKIFYSTF